MHFHIIDVHLELLFHKCISLFHYAISSKTEINVTVPKSIFDPHHVSSITKGRKNNIPRNIEVHIICITSNYFSTTISGSKIKNYLNVVAINNKKNSKTTRKIILQYYSRLLNNHHYLDLKPLRF